jgi:hypothetical protein
VIAHGDVQTVTDLDTMIRTKVVSLIDQNRGLVNAQKIGALGFSAGGSMAAELGTRWAMGIDPADGTNRNFRVAAIIDYYGPLRMDRSTATDGVGTSTGGGGLFYLHETRSTDKNVDIPGIRQWNSTACYCAARGTSPCNCDKASSQYLAAYLTAYDPKASNRICSFYSDDANLQGFSAAYYVETAKPAHVAAMYFCSGARDSNVDHDQNLHQAVSWWRPEHLMTVTVPNDGHGFPYDVCETAAATAGVTPPIAWLTQTLNATGDFPPIYR